MRKYRLTLLLRSGLTKEKKEKLLSSVKKWIGDTENTSETSFGEKKLSYPIKREKSGEYFVINLESEKIIPDLDKKLMMEEDILRHLMIRKD